MLGLFNKRIQEFKVYMLRLLSVPVEGAYIIESDIHEDMRGTFFRIFCQDELRSSGLNPNFVQASISTNRLAGTVRGMHYQIAPHTEAKIVRVLVGAIYDVLIDLRRESSTYCQWFGTELSSQNRNALYIPQGCAHGFQTLVNNTEVLYQMSEYYHPESARGVRWNDPLFGLQWRMPISIINERDCTYPDYCEE